jgi:hypothetical protein
MNDSDGSVRTRKGLNDMSSCVVMHFRERPAGDDYFRYFVKLLKPIGVVAYQSPRNKLVPHCYRSWSDLTHIAPALQKFVSAPTPVAVSQT